MENHMYRELQERYDQNDQEFVDNFVNYVEEPLIEEEEEEEVQEIEDFYF